MGRRTCRIVTPLSSEITCERRSKSLHDFVFSLRGNRKSRETNSHDSLFYSKIPMIFITLNIVLISPRVFVTIGMTCLYSIFIIHNHKSAKVRSHTKKNFHTAKLGAKQEVLTCHVGFVPDRPFITATNGTAAMQDNIYTSFGYQVSALHGGGSQCRNAALWLANLLLDEKSSTLTCCLLWCDCEVTSWLFVTLAVRCAGLLACWRVCLLPGFLVSDSWLDCSPNGLTGSPVSLSPHLEGVIVARLLPC